MAVEVRVHGPGGHLCTVAADLAATTEQLQLAIEAQTGISPTTQRLVSDLQELLPYTTIREAIAAARQSSIETERPGGGLDLSLVWRSPEQAKWLQHLKDRPWSFDWLREAPQAAREDFEVVLAAVKQHGLALMFAAPALQADRAIVSAAADRNVGALRYAAPALRGDRGIVLAAVARDAGALRFASHELRADREVVLAAVAQHGEALEHVAPLLRADPEVISVAVASCPKALRFAAPEMILAETARALAVARQAWQAPCGSEAVVPKSGALSCLTMVSACTWICARREGGHHHQA